MEDSDVSKRSIDLLLIYHHPCTSCTLLTAWLRYDPPMRANVWVGVVVCHNRDYCFARENIILSRMFADTVRIQAIMT